MGKVVHDLTKLCGFNVPEARREAFSLYDVNPVPDGDALALNVSGFDNSISRELAVSVAKYFNLNRKKQIKL